MIPETTENKGFSKRALLPFVGDLSKSIFGIATENDVRVLAGHINALTRQQNKVVRALAKHGGDLSSYINQVDDRMDNLMEGIKENEVLTKILAAKITNETNKLQENDGIIRGTIRKVTVCRTVSWEVVIVNSVIIDRENISLAHSSKGNGKDTKFCSRTLNTFRVSSFKTNTSILL